MVLLGKYSCQSLNIIALQSKLKGKMHIVDNGGLDVLMEIALFHAEEEGRFFDEVRKALQKMEPGLNNHSVKKCFNLKEKLQEAW